MDATLTPASFSRRESSANIPLLNNAAGTGNSIGGQSDQRSSGNSTANDNATVYVSTACNKQDHTSTKAREANVAPDRVRLGIACMKKKMKSPTMQAFIQQFEQYGCFTVVQFPEEMLLRSPVQEWPNVDCAIMFFSSGFPLDKATDYHKLHRRDTYFLTDPESQKVLLDRRDFYRALELNNIPLPPGTVFCNRDRYKGTPISQLEEFDEYIVVDGKRLDKPFVEKPVDAEDHNVYIYYPKRMGGGCRKMFRKVGDKSSLFDPNMNQVRRTGSFLYEKFVEAVDSADIKCYTVGPGFVHAESRKAPSVDGHVERDDKGKEVRQSETLYPGELMVARKIIKVFRQMVCGFDLLRVSPTEFYVCDVNGWSFVKNNDEYVRRASEIMRDIFLAEVGRRGLHRLFKRTSSVRELMGVVGVYRHADRTPKQKLKLTISSPRILAVAFDGQSHKQEVVVKGENPRVEELERAIREELDECDVESPAITRSPVTMNAALSSGLTAVPSKKREVLERMLEVTSRRHEGLKLQVKPKKHNDAGDCIEAQLVCKWGGWLTEAGESQAKTVGQHFVERIFGNECGPNYLREVTVRSNNERRVMKTARLFVDRVTRPGLRPVEVDEPLLGDNSHAKAHTDQIQNRVEEIMHSDDAHCFRQLPGMPEVLDHFILNENERTPLRAMQKLHALLADLVQHVNHSWRDESVTLYRNEPLGLLRQRWTNIMSAFAPADSSKYDVTKLTDVFDYASYDVCYNQRAFYPIDLYPLFTLSQVISAFVSEYESGLSNDEKFLTGALVGQPLLTRICNDLVSIASGEMPRTRLYFTSASHVNALRRLLYNNDFTEFHNVGTPLELHFLSHFVFKVYRYPASASSSPVNSLQNGSSLLPTTGKADDGNSFESIDANQVGNSGTAAVGGTSIMSSWAGPASGPSDSAQYQIEVHFSTGVDKNMFGIVQGHNVSYGAVSPMIRIHNNLSFVDLRNIVQQCQRTFAAHTGLAVENAKVPRGLCVAVTPAGPSGNVTPARFRGGADDQDASHHHPAVDTPTHGLLAGFPDVDPAGRLDVCERAVC